jgi:hypothetical protein
MEDYSNFSQEAITKAIREILDKAKRDTGASEEEVLMALAVCGRKFMDVNCFELEDQSDKEKV